MVPDPIEVPQVRSIHSKMAYLLPADRQQTRSSSCTIARQTRLTTRIRVNLVPIACFPTGTTSCWQHPDHHPPPAEQPKPYHWLPRAGPARDNHGPADRNMCQCFPPRVCSFWFMRSFRTQNRKTHHPVQGGYTVSRLYSRVQQVSAVFCTFSPRMTTLPPTHLHHYAQMKANRTITVNEVTLMMPPALVGLQP